MQERKFQWAVDECRKGEQAQTLSQSGSYEVILLFFVMTHRHFFNVAPWFVIDFTHLSLEGVMCSTQEYHNNDIHQIGSHDLMMKFLRKNSQPEFFGGGKNYPTLELERNLGKSQVMDASTAGVERLVIE